MAGFARYRESSLREPAFFLFGLYTLHGPLVGLHMVSASASSHTSWPDGGLHMLSALAVLLWLAFLLLITLAEISTMGGVWWRPEPCRCLSILSAFSLLFSSRALSLLPSPGTLWCFRQHLSTDGLRARCHRAFDSPASRGLPCFCSARVAALLFVCSWGLSVVYAASFSWTRLIVLRLTLLLF